MGPLTGYTNFAKLTDNEKIVWSMQFWAKARNLQFLSKFTSTGPNSLIQRITELTETERGAKAVITLVNDLEGDGRAGDRQLEGYEEELTQEDQVIQIDQLRNANKSKGRMAEQRSIVRFREQSRDKLAYWMSDRLDQMSFLALAGVDFGMHNNGTQRVGSDLPLLTYAADVKAPTARREMGYNNTTGILEQTPTSAITAADNQLSWAGIVNLKAYAKTEYVREITMNDGVPFYHLFVTPKAMAKLKQDQDFKENLRFAGVRGNANELFKGTDTIMLDGIAISEFRLVYNTDGAVAPNKWGAGGNVDGAACLFCGAQALGYADIGVANWVEKRFDYDNQPGISIGKITGLLKPQFKSKISGDTQDFGVIRFNVAT